MIRVNSRKLQDFSNLCCKNNAFNLSLRKSILIKEDLPELKRNVSSMPLILFNKLLYNPQWNKDNFFYNLQSYKQFWFHFIK